MAPVSVVESTQKSFFFFLHFILIFIFISSFSVFSHRRFGSRSRSAALGMEVGTPTWGGLQRTIKLVTSGECSLKYQL